MFEWFEDLPKKIEVVHVGSIPFQFSYIGMAP